MVAEEATYSGEFHDPTIQLLEFTDGELAGQAMLRFCFYSRRGAFMRDPVILNDDDIVALREAIQQTPRIHALLRRLVE